MPGDATGRDEVAARARFDRAGPIRRRIRLVVTRRPVAALSARMLPSIDRFVLRRSGGRRTLSGALTGLPLLQLEVRGARSGLVRTVTLLAIPDGDGVLVAAANFGGTGHPAWYRNLRAHPEVVVTASGRRTPVRAVELHGADRDEGFARALELNPGWRRLQRRAGERVIPILRLVPRDGPATPTAAER